MYCLQAEFKQSNHISQSSSFVLIYNYLCCLDNSIHNKSPMTQKHNYISPAEAQLNICWHSSFKFLQYTSLPRVNISSINIIGIMTSPEVLYLG